MIDKVYNLVQSLLRKSGYGILFPARFVAFATQAQLTILNDVIVQYRREQERRKVSVVDTTLKTYESILEIFTNTETLTRVNGGSIQSYHLLPDDYMEFEQAFVEDNEIQKIPSRKKKMYERSLLMAPTELDPICYVEERNLYVLPDTIGVINDSGVLRAYDEVELTYLRYPIAPNWTFTEPTPGQPLFNPSSSEYQDFELPYSMLPRLVTEILALSGLSIRSEYVSQYAAQEESSQFNKDNQ